MSGSHDASLKALAGVLGHRFRRWPLLGEAVTHPGAVGRARLGDYERLEFLGDRVLGLVVAEHLFNVFPEEPEGDLNLRYSDIVRRETATRVAQAIDLGRYLRVAKGEADAGLRANPTILADAMEAVLGAVYLDGGLDAARSMVERLWLPFMEDMTGPPRDAKTTLQEWALSRGLPVPAYRAVASEGPPHEPRFTVAVVVEGQAPVEGAGRSKRAAEQAAAARMLARLGERHDGE
ncbi:MAG: ribonuclease III [Alphaproteobacteria bacterium]